MKHTYKIHLQPGNHGVWIFVEQDNLLLAEQPGLTLEEAFKFAQQVVEAEEKGPRDAGSSEVR